MPVPTVITDLSTTAATNYPRGSEAPGPDGDDHIRALGAFIAQLHAGSTSVSAGILKSSGTSIAAATADVDYQSALTAASQAEMEAGTESAIRKMSPLRVAQAIYALGGIDQIQEFSAAVGSNALTISAGTLSLDFRSATLGSGTVTRVTGDPADLVISSGSTLGSSSGEESIIAVVVLNNSGTLELAVTNVAGGVSLDETGLISTTAEGGAGAADSANVVYSATARSNLPYRVIGFIKHTQATAGTYATAPSKIQGAGGQAIVGMASTARQWASVLGSRTLGVSYTNTSNYDKEVSICVQVSSNPSAIDVTQNGVTVRTAYVVPGGATVQMYTTVPPGASYMALSAASVVIWAERG